MHLKRGIGLMALSLGLVAAGPAAAQPGDQPGHGHRAHAGRGGGDVPGCVARRVKRAERALDRASGYVDDGNDSAAASSLGAVRKNLAAAHKAAGKRVAAAADNGPDAAGAVAFAQDEVITEVSGLFDGADALVADFDTTLTAAWAYTCGRRRRVAARTWSSSTASAPARARPRSASSVAGPTC
jgi:hypothetical protein